MSGSNFGELVLILGDLHIPERANKISAPFKRMLVPNKMQHLICTGNVTSSEQYQELLSLAPAVHCVAGDCDCEDESFQQSQQHQNPQQQQQQASNTGEMSFPETCVIQVGQFRIGVIHGHQLIPWGSKEAVDRMRRKLRVDVLVTGHTHQNTVVDEGNGYLHINPGSITGAYSSLTDNVTPSFILLAVQDSKIVCYVYELINGEVEVSKTEFTKQVPVETTSGTNPALLDTLLK